MALGSEGATPAAAGRVDAVVRVSRGRRSHYDPSWLRHVDKPAEKRGWADQDSSSRHSPVGPTALASGRFPKGCQHRQPGRIPSVRHGFKGLLQPRPHPLGGSRDQHRPQTLHPVHDVSLPLPHNPPYAALSGPRRRRSSVHSSGSVRGTQRTVVIRKGKFLGLESGHESAPLVLGKARHCQIAGRP